MAKLTHVDDQGRARMVDVGAKAETAREAVARGAVYMAQETLALIRTGQAQKGDVLGVARVAGILAAKKTGELIPLCHPLPLTHAEVNFRINEAAVCVEVEARVRTFARTGVEMEALTAVSVACLTIYDMAKAADKGMRIEAVCLIKKTGGKSGTYVRPGEQPWEA